MPNLPTFFPSKILNLCLLLCDVGREFGNFKLPKVEKAETYEVGNNEEAEEQSQSLLPLLSLPTIPSVAHRPSVFLPLL